MGTIWFSLVAIMLTVYVFLDGFDLGAGAIHLLVAKQMKSGGQFWRALAGLGRKRSVVDCSRWTLYFAFPTLYASAFSGFYLPLMIVLWLLILRGASIEFRNHIKSAIGIRCGISLLGSSLLLAVFFGAALGNVVRGVPLDASGYFFEPRGPISASETKLASSTGTNPGGSLSPARAHDARWTVGADEDQRRSPCARGKTGWPDVVGVAALTALVTAVTFRIQPQLKKIYGLAVGFLSPCLRWPG